MFVVVSVSTDRLIDRHIERETDRQTDRQTDRHTDIQTTYLLLFNSEGNIPIFKTMRTLRALVWTDGQTEIHTDRHTDRQRQTTYYLIVQATFPSSKL